MKIQFYKLIDLYIGVPLCLLIGVINKLFSKKQIDNPKRIAIIKLWAIGDSVVLLPMISLIKKRFPEATIDVFSRKRNKDVFIASGIVNNVMLVEFYNIINILKSFRSYDVVIDAEPYLRYSALLSFFLSSTRIGFAKQLRSVIYTHSSLFRHDQHMVKNYVDLIKYLSINYVPNELVELKYSLRDENAVNAYLKGKNIKLGDKFVLICPGVAESSKTRMWDNEKLAQLSDFIIRTYNVNVIFIGTKNEFALINKILETTKIKAVNAAGKFSLFELFYLIKRSRLVISTDTGPMHIAAAQKITTIGLFGPNTPVLWAPYGNNISIYKNVECSPCIKNDKGYTPDCLRKTDRYLCMKLISVEEVIVKVNQCLTTN